MNKRLGNDTIKFENPIYFSASASVVGEKEGRGRFGDLYDKVYDDNLFEKKTFEIAEQTFFEEAVKTVIHKSKVNINDVKYIIGGDLLNQITTTSMSARYLELPFIGVYSACSTITLSLILGACLIDGGFADKIIAAASSHFCTAERQYRFPLEMGVQRCPTAQWTTTGAGAFLLEEEKSTNPNITHATIGKVKDFGIKDVNDMGAAMAPAAADTFINHFNDTGFSPNDYDRIVTGDLGIYGSQLLKKLMAQRGFNIDNNHEDCGAMIFYESQNVQAGGSGAGCSGVVLSAYFLDKILKGDYQKILFASTGALLSTTSAQQGDTIPGIAHAITIEKG